MRHRRSTKRPKVKDSQREWDDWQRYVKKETQRLMRKTEPNVVELSVAEPEPTVSPSHETPAHPRELNPAETETITPSLGEGRKPPIPGVSREEALGVSDDQIGGTVRPFTVRDYRDIRPLTSAELFGSPPQPGAVEPLEEPAEASTPPESAQVSTQVETHPEPSTAVTAIETPPEPKPPKVDKTTKKGRKKKQDSDEPELFAKDIAEHQALKRRRLTRKSRLHREELIEKLLDPVISLEEAATLIGVCKTTVRRYTNRGELHCLRTPGQQRRFKLGQVLEFVKRREDQEKARRTRRRRDD